MVRYIFENILIYSMIILITIIPYFIPSMFKIYVFSKNKPYAKEQIKSSHSNNSFVFLSNDKMNELFLLQYLSSGCYCDFLRSILIVYSFKSQYQC